MACNFRVGQKVVCVDDKSVRAHIKWADIFPEDAVYAGQIYTITSVHLDAQGNEVVWLAEVSRMEIAKKHIDPMIGYGSWRFRPVVERKTDISVFQRMLNTTPETVGA